MKRNRRGLPKALCYLCLIIVLCLGLISIIGSGGGGGGGTAITDGGGGTGDGDGGTGGNGGTTPPEFSGFDFTLSEGDFWEYKWDYYKNSWAQGSSGSTTRDSGTFRVTLGSAKEIDGVTAYEVEVTGKTGNSDEDFAPRWKYLAVEDNQILGSEDGTTLTTLFDGQIGAWPGAGYFTSISSSALVTGNDGQIDNDYITESCIAVSQSDSESQCEYFPGIGNICGDSSYSWTENEYYKEGIGPIGYYYYNTFSDCGGGFCSGATWTHNVGLVASSLQGDTADYDLESEPNDSPDTAQTANPPSTIKGSGSVTDGTAVIVNGIQEAEANDSPNDPQNLNGPILVTGDAKVGDSSSNFSYTYNSNNYSVDAEDWYTFSLNSQTTVTITLDFQQSSTADLDLFLFDDQFSTMLGLSVADNPNTGNPTETITKTLDTGTYIIAVDAFATPEGSTDYTLNVVYSGEKDNEQEIEDWYTFTLDSQSDVTITLDFGGGTSRDFDLYLFNSSGDTVLASSRGDNPTSSDFSETITKTLNAGTYLIGVDAYSGSGDYTLEVE